MQYEWMKMSQRDSTQVWRPASFMDGLKRKRKLFYTKYIPEDGGGGGGGGGGAGGGGGGGIGMV